MVISCRTVTPGTAALLSLSLLGCAVAAPPATTPASVAPPTVAPTVAPPAPVASEPTAPEPAVCSYTAEPRALAPALVVPDNSGACRAPPAKEWRALQAEVRKRWHRSWPKGRLQIDRGCDRQDPRIDSLVLESSGGHGGSLTLASLDRRPDGDYDLVLLEYNHYQRPRPKDPEDPYQRDSAGPLAVYHRQLPAATMAPLLVRLRATAQLEIVEHEPPPTPDTMVGGGVGTSHSYHVALRLTDHQGRGVQRYFAGYERSGEQQRDGVPMAIVQDTVSALLHDDAFTASLSAVGVDDPAGRALFARVFWQAHARGEDFGSWYVRERLLGMAALLGSDQHVPALLAPLQPTTDAPRLRSTALALNAIAAITGFDRRHDPSGTPREVAEVAAETLAACAQPGR